MTTTSVLKTDGRVGQVVVVVSWAEAAQRAAKMANVLMSKGVFLVN